MSDSEVFKILDLYDNVSFNKLLHMAKFSEIVNFNELYKKWRKDYISSKRKFKNIDLDEYVTLVAKRSKSFVTPKAIKQAIKMKQEHIAIKEIAKETNMTISKLDYLFTNAFRVGILNENNYRTRTLK